MHTLEKLHFWASLFTKLSKLERIKLTEETNRYLIAEVDTVKCIYFNIDIVDVSVIPHPENEMQFFPFYYGNKCVPKLDVIIPSLPYYVNIN